MAIRVGTAGWTDPSLIKSKLFYPKGVSTAEERLRYYASVFPMVEVDSTYYALPSESNAKLWVERTPEDFVWNIKAFRLFTGHQTPANALPKDIAEELSSHFEGKRNLYYKDVPAEIRDELWKRYERGVRPLHKAGRLAALHFQFPRWVTPAPDWQHHLEECVGRLPGYRLAFEFRNRTWYDGKHDHKTIAMERDLGVAHVVVDEPQTGASSIPQVWEIATPDLVIVRMHGRNHETWDKKGLKAASDRFDYDYSDAELREVAKPIVKLSRDVKDVHVVFNNNREDQGQRNGLALMKILGKLAIRP
ncbi:DUF72 domain-containing protein [Lysobacter sp. TY2-98]|uniref:DUF72 domain-containing protein n=1 Tax=Lysobacter sp. TY2-98 TaxID=2290922 RepID=UPI000E1FD75C|nr:DUF72 domain-containing protein [Lysobacter sp. TY2-98]AXK72029.1 DUF72 domain-containing protein [Lysobacter sp. TY2-98]